MSEAIGLVVIWQSERSLNHLSEAFQLSNQPQKIKLIQTKLGGVQNERGIQYNININYASWQFRAYHPSLRLPEG